MTDWRTELQTLVKAYDAHGGRWPQHHEDALMAAVEHARAVLARWGNHVPDATKTVSPPAEGDVGVLMADLQMMASQAVKAWQYNDAESLTRAADLLLQQEGRIEQAYQYGRRDAEADAQQAAESAEDEPSGEVAELVRWLRTVGIEAFSSKRWCDQITRAADLLEQQQHLMVLSAKEVESLLEQRQPVPVPASERKPGPEDCDAEGRCWWFNPGQPAMSNPHIATSSWRLCRMLNGKPMGTNWLPAHTLPLPQGR